MKEDIIVRKIKEKINNLQGQLEYVNGEIAEHAQENSTEGQVIYVELLQKREQIEQRVEEALCELKEFTNATNTNASDINIGRVVRIRDENREFVAKLVENPTSVTIENHITVNSPLGKALIGKTPGQQVVVSTPAGQKNYEVIEVM